MQYKFLLVGFLIFTTVNSRNAIPTDKTKSVTGDNIFNISNSTHHKNWGTKAAIPFWETGKQKDAGTDTASIKQTDWYAGVVKNIEEKEYEINYDEDTHSYTSPNRKNNLRAFYTANTFTLLPRNDSADKWKLDLTLQGIYSGKQKIYSPDANAAVTQSGKTIQFNHNNNFTLEYINSKAGVRQNFIIQKEPASKSQTINLKLSAGSGGQTNKGWFVNKVHDKEIHFAKGTKTGYNKKITYNDLRVWDASNKELKASFVVNNNIISIHVNTVGAIYPITIDPLSTTPNTSLNGMSAGDAFGWSVASAGDVNGDGYSDVIIGAQNVSSQKGAAYLYLGSATGLSTSPSATLSDPNNTNIDYFGYSVASACDVNRDGFSDVIIGAYGVSSQKGAAYLYLGSVAGLSTSPSATLSDPNNTNNDLFGYSVASTGDVNGDEYSDVIVGAVGLSTLTGAAYLYLGSAAGLPISPSVTLNNPNNTTFEDFGGSVASAGDVNGDGYSDVIIGAQIRSSRRGAAYLYLGSVAGLSTSPSTSLSGIIGSGQFGCSVASAGDVNGDGYSDVIIGAQEVFSYTGAAYLYLGSAAGLTSSPATTLSDPNNTNNDSFGYSVASAGDVNGDGYSDVIVGAHGVSSQKGAAYFYLGSAIGLSFTPATTLSGISNNDNFGYSVACAGDVNGDGYCDIIVGAYGVSSNKGAAYVYHGSPDGLSNSSIWSVEGNQVQAEFGLYTASIACAGDVNGDGYSDVIIGSALYDDGLTNQGKVFVYYGSPLGLSATADWTAKINQAGAYFGWAVASAGDVNGDGYSDVIIGAVLYTNTETNEGGAFVFHGSGSGLSATANWTAESDQVNAQFGFSAASAGDVNGDGYSDVIIGAIYYDDPEVDEGRAYVYYGSSSGLLLTATWTSEINVSSATYGYSVASAGDVNGDGFSDVIIGAWGYSNPQIQEGGAFVFYGSLSGLSSTPNWTGESNQAGAHYGVKIAPAGDVNGDGFSDIIVGAHDYDNGSGHAGKVFVYYGSASGLPVSANWTAQSAQPGAFFGIVSSAGDVNGDGYSDVIVGAFTYDNGQTDEGGAFVYNGSATGLSATANWMAESNQANANFGYSVACAGDVNGDGFSDILIGAPGFSNGESFEGKIFLYYGNNSGGLRNNLRLYNTDLVTPIQWSNYLVPNLFGAGLYSKSPLGRVKGKLVWEVKAKGLPFSGNPITNSTAFFGKQPSLSDLGIAGTELKYNVQKQGMQTKIRVRVEYDKVTAITGQVYGPWRYTPGYTQGAYGMNSIPLPITLISFNGQFINADDVQLKWITSNEINMQTFIVERSFDALNFTAVGELAATGTGSNRTDYSFTDRNVQHNLLYYRLKLKDKSGELSYTKTITLSRSKMVKGFIAPNPVQCGNDALLTLQSASDKNSIHISIFNSSVQLVFSANKILQTGKNEIALSTNKLAKGIYTVHVLGDGMKESYKLVLL